MVVKVTAPRSPLGDRILLAVALLIGCGIFLGPILFFALPLVLPEGYDLDSVPSSDNGWVAVVRQEIRGAGVFSDPYYAVVLRPGAGWIGWLRGEKIFEVYGNRESGEPAVIWTGPHELEVRMRPALQYKPTLQVGSHRDVHITYDVTYTGRSD